MSLCFFLQFGKPFGLMRGMKNGETVCRVAGRGSSAQKIVGQIVLAHQRAQK